MQLGNRLDEITIAVTVSTELLERVHAIAIRQQWPLAYALRWLMHAGATITEQDYAKTDHMMGHGQGG